MHSKGQPGIPSRSPEVDSRQLVSGLRENRPDAIATVTQWAYAVARHGAWGFETADDIVQEALLALLRNLELGRFDGGDLRAYVRRITKNICISSYRRKQTRGVEVNVTGDLPAPHASSEGRTVEHKAMVQRILARLDGPCREIITLAYFHGLSRREIAARYRITETAAKVRLFRCMERARMLQVPPSEYDVLREES